MDYTKTPPEFQPDAIPSQYGWHHPITNELLVSVPGGVKLEQVIINVVDPNPEVEEPKVDSVPLAITEVPKEGLLDTFAKALKRGKRSK